MNNCKQELEQAIGRRVSDTELRKIEQELVTAKKEVAKDVGREYGKLSAEEKAKLVAEKLNSNRSKTLSDIENSILSQTKLLDKISGATLGKDLADISVDELAANIRNMIANKVNGRADFIERGGRRATFADVKSSLINGRFGESFSRLLSGPLSNLVSGAKFFLDRDAQIKVADEIVNGNLLKDLINDINREYEIAGLDTRVKTLDLNISRDAIVDLHNNNNRATNQAAKAFEDIVKPLLDPRDTTDLRDLYQAMYSRRATLVDEGGIGEVTIRDALSELKFKDGKSLMTFIESFGMNKTIPTHIVSMLDRVASDIAKEKIFGKEDIVGTINKKIEMSKDVENINALVEAKNAYVETVLGSGRKWDTGVLDLSIATLKNLTSYLYLGISALKGVVTDRIFSTAALAAEGRTSDIAKLQGKSGVDLLKNIGLGILRGKEGWEVDLFYQGIEAKTAALGHYLNVFDQSVLSSNPVTRFLQQSKRFTGNLAGKVQALAAQNANTLANQRALSQIAQGAIFNKTYRPSILGLSLSPTTHAEIVRLDLNSYTDLKNLTRSDYNSKMGKNLTEEQFITAKDKLMTDVEASIVYQINSLQIVSGGDSVKAQVAAWFGTSGDGGIVRRYVWPLLGQFSAYPINFVINHKVVQGIIYSKDIPTRAKWIAVYTVAALMAGYSNQLVGDSVKNGVVEAAAGITGTEVDEDKLKELHPYPWDDIVAMFDDDLSETKRQEARDRLKNALIGGSSLPFLKQLLGDGLQVTALSPVYKIGKSVGDVVTGQEDIGDGLNDISNTFISNSPIFMLLREIKDIYLKEAGVIDEDE